MSAPTNPKKKSLMPSGPLRRTLRAAGHHLSPIVQVGKEGATEAVARQLEQALYDHELVKVKVGAESPEDRFEAADRLAAAAGGQLAQILGRTLLVYKRHPEAPRFEPRAPAEVEAPVERAPPRPPRRAVPLRDVFRREAGARKARRDAPDVSGARGDAPRRKGPRADGPARKGTRAGGAGWKGARGEGAARKSGRAGGAAWKGTRAEGAGWKGTRAEGAVRKGGRAGGAARKGTRGEGAGRAAGPRGAGGGRRSKGAGGGRSKR